MNSPENDWIQCQSPEDIQDALTRKKQTSTGQTRNIIRHQINKQNILTKYLVNDTSITQNKIINKAEALYIQILKEEKIPLQTHHQELEVSFVFAL